MRPSLRNFSSASRSAAIVAIAAAVAIVGCSSKKVREPSKLPDLGEVAFRVETVWSSTYGDGSGATYTELRPDVEADAVYAADIDGVVYALARDDGERLWTAKTGEEVISGPSASGDLVLVGTRQGTVVALSRADGTERWRAQLSSEVVAAPAGGGGVVVARSVDGRVYGLSADDGHRLWAFDRSVPPLVLRGSSAPLIIGPLVLVGMDNGRVAALRLADGQVVWEQAISVPTGRNDIDRITDIDANLLDGPNCVFVASFGGEVTCVDLATSRITWRREVRTYNSMALGDKLYITDESGVVWALDPETGAAAWQLDSLKFRQLSPPAYIDGHVVVGDYEGYLHWLDPSDGHIVARSRVGRAAITAQPVAGDNGLLYVMNVKGRIAAVKPAG